MLVPASSKHDMPGGHASHSAIERGRLVPASSKHDMPGGHASHSAIERGRFKL